MKRKHKKQVDLWGLLAEGLELKNAQLAMVNAERRKQEEMVGKSLLPSRTDPGEKEFLTKFGVKFLDLMDDKGFQRVELPQGWKKVASGHQWLSMLVDNQGRERARIFYKHTYYDLMASLHLVPRYGLWEDPASRNPKGPSNIAATVIDGGEVLGQGEILFMTQPVEVVGSTLDKMRVYQQHKKEAYAWLNQKFPNWEDKFAYWD
ncbi:hypothetical protein ACFL2U_00675 [Patescibacteria group bacterium]